LKKLFLSLLIALIPLSIFAKSDSELSFSLGKNTGKDSSESSLIKYNLNKEEEYTRQNLEAFSSFSKNSNGINDDRKLVSYRYEINNNKFFPLLDLLYYRNKSKDIDNRFGAGIGIGYYILKNKKEYLSCSYIIDRYSDDENYFINKFEERFKYRILETLYLKQKFTYEQAINKNNKYEYYNLITLSNKITEKLDLDIHNETIYKSRYKGQKQDNRFGIGLKYKF